MHFLESGHRPAEVLECRAAEEEIERLVFEWHARRVALAKIDLDPATGAVPLGKPDEGAADVESGDIVSAERGKLDCEITWAGRHFQNPATGGEPIRHSPCERLEILHRFLGHGGIPLGDETLHSQTFVGLYRYRMFHKCSFVSRVRAGAPRTQSKSANAR